MKLVFLLEEQSMKYLLDGILPKILPKDVDYQLVPHSGKRDLEKSLPIKIRAWNEPEDVRFVVLHDQDNKDCKVLKDELLKSCSDSKRPVLVRIVCQELESWYFGDVCALAEAYGKPKLLNLSKKKQYRVPDKIPDPKHAICKEIPEHQQIMGAKRIAPHMRIEHNTSVSFQFFVSGVRRLATENI